MTISADAASRREGARQVTGRFGYQAHSESSVCLADPDEVFGEQGVMANVHRIAGANYRSRGLDARAEYDADDVEQEVLLQMLERRRRDDESGEGNTVQNWAFFSNAVSRNVAYRWRNGKEVPRSYREAMLMLRRRSDEAQQRLQRTLTKDEIAEIKTGVLADFGDRTDRPPFDFDDQVRAHDGGAVYLAGAGVEGEDVPSGYTPVAQDFDQLRLQDAADGTDTKTLMAYTEAIEGYRSNPNTSMAQREVRQNAWVALAHVYDLPEVEADSIPYRAVQNARKTIADLGGGDGKAGLREAVRQYQDGGCSDEVEQALFCAFGQATEAQRDRVAEFITDQPQDRQWAVWDLAVARADRKTMSSAEAELVQEQKASKAAAKAAQALDAARAEVAAVEKTGQVDSLGAAHLKLRAAQDAVASADAELERVRPPEQKLALREATARFDHDQEQHQLLVRRAAEQVATENAILANARRQAAKAQASGDRAGFQEAREAAQEAQKNMLAISARVRASHEAFARTRAQLFAAGQAVTA